ncbi:hypothetical protein HYFRA_00010930 [Hymenoscyphus fraxineus]|uniref:Uncharacterized protein n=1 Tax=Hymenoscyphus fraxineus TaxID=746836 RepID=A0A9N9KZ19_9HELO|nr:hypothetical protein HYFRA_00010930 [Hymenoscyphus fraxineus]
MIQLITLLFFAAVGSANTPAAVWNNIVGRAEPGNFTADPTLGPGGDVFKDSSHFRLYGTLDEDTSNKTLNMMEAAYDCFVTDLGWRSTGLSVNISAEQDALGPFTKTNIYSVNDLGSGIAGQFNTTDSKGMAWFSVVNRKDILTDPVITISIYAFAMMYHERSWMNNQNSGGWWKVLGGWAADASSVSDLCAPARAKHGVEANVTYIDLKKVLGNAHQVIVGGSNNSSNVYDAWPFFTYLTNNLDNFEGLGKNTIRELMRQYEPNSNETPLHTLSRISTCATVGELVGKYWARMAYWDIGHAPGLELLFNWRYQVNYTNVDLVTEGEYKVIAARQPRYMGANIIPLNVTGAQTVDVEITGSMEFTATLVVRNMKSGVVTYTELENGAGWADVAVGDEASLVVANTPETLHMYKPYALSPEVSKGLDYSFTICGATVLNGYPSPEM